MAGSKRHVAKWIFSLGVLATAGGGVYYGLANGWHFPIGAHGGQTAELTADPSGAGTASTSDLDAVASAWSAPSTTPSTTAPPSSADVPTPLPVKAPVASDRYVTPADYEEPTEADHNATDYEPRQFTPQEAPRQALPAKEDRYATPDAAPMALPASDQPVARGQDNQLDDAEDDEPAASNRNPLRASTARHDASPSSRRAQEAFSDAGDSAAGARYARATSDVNPFGAKAEKESRQVNPFSSQPAPLPAATESANPIASARSSLPDEVRRPEGLSADDSDDDAGSSRIPNIGNSNNYGSNRRPSALDNDLGTQGNDVLPFGPDNSYGTKAEGTGRPGERSLEGPQQASLVIQKFAPPEIQVGKPAKFVVQVQNVGTRSADNVEIHDEVPHGTRLVSTSPRADVSGSQILWQLGTLSAGEQRSVEVQVMPTEEGEIGSVASVTFAAPASVKTRCTMPQLAIRMTAPSQVMIGEEQRVKIELRNPGSGDATGVMLYENVPEEVRHEAGPTLEFEIGTLRPGEIRELELILLAEKAGEVLNTLTARADGNLQVQQQVEFEVIAPALEVDVVGPDRRYLERPATYQVTVSNPGTAAARDVEIVTKLPKGMRFIRANNMGEYDATTHAIYWSLAELPEGEQGTVELVAMPVEAGQQTLEVEGRAQRGLTDQTKRQVLVEGLAAIMFEVKDKEDPIEVGGDTTYEIRVVNQGSKAATNVRVAVNVPSGMQVLAANGETRHVIESGGVLFEPLAQLAPKADSVFHVQVQGVRPGDQRVTVEVDTDDIGHPVRKEESTRVFGDE